MNEMINITPVIGAAITLLAAIITAVVVPLIKNKLGDEKYSRFRTIVQTLVSAAEMLYTASGSGAQKLEYVMNAAIAEAEKLGLKIEPDELRAIIESYVYGLKAGAQ